MMKSVEQKCKNYVPQAQINKFLFRINLLPITCLINHFAIFIQYRVLKKMINQHQEKDQGQITIVSALTKILESSKSKQDEMSTDQIKVGRKFVFFMDIGQYSEQPLKTAVEVEDHTIVQQAIFEALQKFSHQCKQRNLNLNTDFTNFIPRLSKKNGRPKLDMPSIDIKQNFSQIKFGSSSLQIKNLEAAFNSNSQEQKSQSKNSIKTQIGFYDKKDKDEILDEEEISRKNKNQTCFFSFC